MSQPLVVESLDRALDYVGTVVGPSDWIEVTQERIDRFAEATGDTQWIHTDPERARRESPWKSTIAHGYLTLSLAPVLLARLIDVRGFTTAINTGIDKTRLTAPVPAGSRVRLTAEIKRVRSLPGGGVRVTFGLRFEVEGSAKPACLASVNYVYR